MKRSDGSGGSGRVRRALRPAYAAAVVGCAAASIECGKLVLAVVPNVEVVTLLTALYGYVFGWYGILAAVVFVTIEPLIYGFGPWVISYYLYWPFVALVFALLGRAKVRNRAVLTGAAVLLTLWFGVLTSLVDVGLFSGHFERFFYRFSVFYARGIVFYAIQVACNAVLFPLVFRFLADRLARLRIL